MSNVSGHAQEPIKAIPKLCSMTMQPIVQADTTIKEITHASATQANTQLGNLVAFLEAGNANKGNPGMQIREIL